MKYGFICVAVGIMLAVLAGYLLSAETVTTCETEWEYVTDVSGAFQGSNEDMRVDYSPSSNVTGWSHTHGYNYRVISGVDYQISQSANTYSAITTPKSFAQQTFTVASLSHAGNLPEVNYTVAGQTYGPMPDGWALDNSEIVTVFMAAGGPVEGSYAAPLSDVMDAIGYRQYTTVDVSQSSATGYPCFAAVDRTMAVSGSRVTSTFTPSSWAPSARILCQEDMAVIDGKRIPLSEALIVWGHADGGSGYVDDVSINATMTIGGRETYIDPSAGFAPKEETYERQVLTVTQHGGSANTHFMMSAPQAVIGECTAEISIEAKGQYAAAAHTICSIMIISSPSQIACVVSTGGQDYIYSTTDPVLFVQFAPSGTPAYYAVKGDGGTAAGGPSGNPTEICRVVADLSLSRMTFTNIPKAHQADFTLECYNDGGESFTMDQDDASMTARLSYETTTAQTVTETYTSAYWCNDYENSGISVLFRPTGPVSMNSLLFESENESTIVIVRHDSTGWTARISGSTATLGPQWQGAMLTIEDGRAVFRPVASFVSFSDYTLVNAPQELSGVVCAGEPITDISVPYVAGSLRMAVVSTTVLIRGGGLYLQDASADLLAAFPGTEAMSITIGSAARYGTGITFASGGQTATVPISEDGKFAQIGGKQVPVNGLTFRWYSSSGPSATVGSQTYAPAIYWRGNQYDAGKIWAVTGGGMEEIIDAPTSWTVKLDGVWAPAINLYTGQNDAAQKTEMSDVTKGIFFWDDTELLIGLMAFTVAGGAACSYFGYMRLSDWVIVAAALGSAWVMLG